MSRHVADVPFAVGTDGRLYVSLTNWGATGPRTMLKRALREPGSVLVAVQASDTETRKILDRLQDGALEAVALATASRDRRRRREVAKRKRSSE